MRYLILNTDYPDFLHWLYTQNPSLQHQSYDEQMRARNESLFGVADFYSSNLRKLGHEAWDIHLNNEPLQRVWAAEHSVALPQQRRSLQFRLRRGFVPWLSLGPAQDWMYAVLDAQIKHYKPDVVLNQDLGAIRSDFLRELKPRIPMLVGQIASPLPKGKDFRCYDLILSSLPNFVEFFRKNGLPAEQHRFAFEPRISKTLRKTGTPISVSFVGSLSRYHKTRIELLEYLCRRIDLRIWGQGVETLASNSLLRRCYQGKAWGRQMYQILYNSQITLNHHIAVAENYANNMRLFEATGVGTLLLTDWKQNLHEMFEPKTQLVAYRSPVECAEMVEYYLAHTKEGAPIARAGQQRTLQEHTYEQRMRELVEIIEKYV